MRTMKITAAAAALLMPLLAWWGLSPQAGAAPKLEASSVPGAPGAAGALPADPGGPPAVLFTAPGSGAMESFGSFAVLGAELAHRVYSGGYALIVESEGEGPLYNRVPGFSRVRAAAGHLFESTLAENAPYYRRANIPVLLPFLDNWETPVLGGAFYQMMPDVPAQARLLAERTLKIPAKKLSRIVILESPAPPFQLLADTYEDTLRNPAALSAGKKKARPLSPKVKVVRAVVSDKAVLAAVMAENRLTPQDVVVLALSSRQAVSAAPQFVESNFQKALFLGGASLASRDVCMAYLAARTNLELVVPRDLRNTKDPALNEFVQRFRLLNRQDPAWPSVTAYDAVTMAVKAAASPEGEGNLAAEDKVHTGLAGEYSFSSRRVPGEVVKVSADSVVYFP